MDSIRVNGQRLWDSLMAMAQFGATKKGGCNRLALSDEDKLARDLFCQWCNEAGCTVTIDQFGNIFAKRKGKNKGLPSVATGSHLDTQPTGGKFDGVFGVLSGLEVLRTLNEHNIETDAPFEFTVWTNEEGSRFQPAMQGSGVFVGRFDLETEWNKKDINGVCLRDELERIGYLGSEPIGQRNIGAFFEAHIEQGPILEKQEQQVGIVRLGQGIRWYDVYATGQESHSGTTPMGFRKDALAASCEIITEIEKLANNVEHAVATTGFLQVSPNSRNTIAGSVKFSVDLRNPYPDVLERMHDEFNQLCNDVSLNRKVDIKVDHFWYFAPVEFKASQDVKQAAEKLGYTHMDIVAGAGHDACYMSDIVPSGMVFTPCENGISHNEIENTTLEQCEAGANVLLHTMLEASQRLARQEVE
ncbi:Zn-dependent hydrolase [Parashewanella spongiae]|uniref:Zn-dependent hydrolase n=1 Tax=Parashewanella spongiae TaxID=342950 RepID=A0A3A6TGI6_9GAMM|nr:Zn-dependent hydrolase [Parashewanella spongiae]MCL1080062.1 Zn-dependent hydrolase [Parashewanella spongiae]RJY05980.1 Zn-dependent hydrolase [Parashewanella spongiae]